MMVQIHHVLQLTNNNQSNFQTNVQETYISPRELQHLHKNVHSGYTRQNNCSIRYSCLWMADNYSWWKQSNCHQVCQQSGSNKGVQQIQEKEMISTEDIITIILIIAFFVYLASKDKKSKWEEQQFTHYSSH